LVEESVVKGLKNGWSTPGVCIAIARGISDAIFKLPVYGNAAMSIVVEHNLVAGCEKKKKEIGC